MMKMHKYLNMLLGISMLFALSGTLDFAGAADADYPNKPITWVVPYGPGGGFDVISRAVAPIMEEYLPRKVNIIIQNIDGAGGRKGVTSIYRAKPDGYTFGLTNIPGQLIYGLVNKVDYDFSKVAWIGNLSSEPVAIYASKVSGIKTFADLMKAKKLKFGSGGKGSGEDINARFANAVLDLKADVVTGYSGSHEVILGLIRGDAHLIAITVSSGYQYVTSGDLIPILVMGGKKRSSLMPDVPLGVEKGYKTLAAAMLYRALFAPPGTPEARTNILSTALAKALEDKRIVQWSKKTEREVGPVMPNKELKEAIDEIIDGYSKYKELFR